MTEVDSNNALSEESLIEQQPMVEIERDGTHYVVLGTAHVSRKSADAVRELITQQSFDAIAVELCDSRIAAIRDPDAWQQMDLFQIIRQGKGGLVAANLALSAYQRRLAEQFGIEPGAEMKVAVDLAKHQDLPVLTIDRDVGITLKRVYGSVKFLERVSILGGLTGSLITSEEITEQEIERLKEGDMLESAFAEFAERSENLYRSLIGERDEFMAARLREEGDKNRFERVLVVIGAGHLKGMCEHLKEDNRLPEAVQAEYNLIPKGRRWTRFIPWIITAVILTGFAIGFARSPELGMELVVTWVLINGGLAALGALIAGGHPFTVLSGFLAAPLTSLNPTVAAGMVTASVEAWLRKPRILDFTNLRDDVTRLRGWWGNRVSRTLLVLLFSNFGSIAGTYIAGFKIFERLS